MLLIAIATLANTPTTTVTAIPQKTVRTIQPVVPARLERAGHYLLDVHTFTPIFMPLAFWARLIATRKVITTLRQL